MQVRTATFHGFTFHTLLNRSADELGYYCEVWCDQTVGAAQTVDYRLPEQALAAAAEIAETWSRQLAGKQTPAGDRP